MLKHTYIFASYLTGLLVHLHGKMTPQACYGLLARGLAMSSAQVEVWEGLIEEHKNSPTLYLGYWDVVNPK